jgi:putative membrane protein
MHIFMEAWMPVSLLVQGGPDWNQHDWGGQRWDGSWWPWILFPLLFWGGVLFLIAWIVARLFPRNRPADRREAPRDPAEEILRERFARGEISAEEYGRSLEILRGEPRRATNDPGGDEGSAGGTP